MTATFTIDQPFGAGAGSAGEARRDIWLGQQVLLTALDLSPGGYVWEFQPGGIPPGSLAVIVDGGLQQASFTPDLPGSYRVRLLWNGGGAGRVSTKVIRVTKDPYGLTLNRGWGVPAFDERPDETNFSGNFRGSTPEFEFIFADLLTNAFGASAPAGTGFVRVTAGVYDPPAALTTFDFAPNIISVASLLATGHTEGDIVMRGPTFWDVLQTPPSAGYVLTSNAPATSPSWQLPAAAPPSTVTYRPDAVTSGIPGVYHTMPLAVAAAQAIPGRVDIIFDPSVDPLAPTGTHDLERRIGLVGMAIGGTLLPLNVDATASVFENAVYVEGFNFTGNYAAPCFTTTDGSPQDLTFSNTSHTEVASATDLIALNTGTNKLYLEGNSALDSTTRALFTLTATKQLNLFVEDGYVGAMVVGGAAGTLTVKTFDSGTLVPPSAFSGTLVTSSTVFGDITYDASAGGTLTLGVGEYEAYLIVITGSPPGDVLINLPAINGREWAIYNNFGDPTKKLEVKTTGGSQQRKIVDTTVLHVVVVDGELESDDNHQPVRWTGVAGAQSTDLTTWTTVGAMYIDPTMRPIGDEGVPKFTAILEVADAGVVVHARLLDSALVEPIGSDINSTVAAETFPEAVTSVALDWAGLGSVKKTYVVQIKRVGGVSGNKVYCHQAFLEVRWD